MPSWINSAKGHVPMDAFKAGRDANGIVYVGRSKHESDLLPGKVVPAHATAYVCYDGKEWAKDEYQVLCGYAFYWVPISAQEELPQRVVSAGQTACKEILYVGRVLYRGVDVVGKVQRTHNGCYIPYGGDELHFKEFEILVEAVEA